MMRQAVADGSISKECFAKTNSHCNNAVLAKHFFWDAPVICITLQLSVNVTLEIVMIMLRTL